MTNITDIKIPEGATTRVAGAHLEEQPAARRVATVAAETEGSKVTERDVKAKVNKRTTRKEKPAERPKLGPPCDGMQFAQMAIMDLEKIRVNDTEREEAFATVRRWFDANS